MADVRDSVDLFQSLRVTSQSLTSWQGLNNNFSHKITAPTHSYTLAKSQGSNTFDEESTKLRENLRTHDERAHLYYTGRKLEALCIIVKHNYRDPKHLHLSIG